MASDPEIKDKKLVGATSLAKWKWQMNVHFEQYDIMSITDGSWKCPNITNTEKVSEDDQRNFVKWKRYNAWKVVLIMRH